MLSFSFLGSLYFSEQIVDRSLGDSYLVTLLDDDRLLYVSIWAIVLLAAHIVVSLHGVGFA